MDAQTGRPRVIVVGLGSYYRKLALGIRDLFEVATLADSQPSGRLQLEPRELTQFRQVDEKLEHLEVENSIDCVMLLTPPAFHVSQCELLARHRKPILVEKPLAINTGQIERLIDDSSTTDRLYCSDFYADVRGTPLLTWAGRAISCVMEENIRVVGDVELFEDGIGSIGRIKEIQGKLLEGAGAARQFEGRDWLWDADQGGVVLDLMYHYIVLTSCVFDQLLIPDEVVLKTRRPDATLVEWRRGSSAAETYASCKGKLAGGTPFEFEVAKYWGYVNERFFKLQGSDGTATMTFADPNILVLEKCRRRCEVQVVGSYYRHVVACFADYVRSREVKPHGFQHAVRAVRMCDVIRDTTL